MARVAGVDIPNGKRVEIALQSIYGIGIHRAKTIVKEAKIDKSVRVKDLDDKQLGDIRKIIDESFKVEGNLRKDVQGDKKRLRTIRCHRGRMDARGLPARGQRTKTNARTRKGPVRIAVKGKKKVAK